MPGLRTVTRAPVLLLAQLKVGTKLMLLVLLPVCVLLGFTSVNAVADWRFANELGSYQTATQMSFATAALADQLAAERTAAVLLALRPGARDQDGLASARHDVNNALHQAEDSAAGWHGTIDVAGRLDAASRQLGALRLQVSAGSLSVQEISDSYSVITNDLINTVGDLIAGRHKPRAGQPTRTWLSCRRSRRHSVNARTWPRSSPRPDRTPRPVAGPRWRAPISTRSAATQRGS
jgi:hypothetical protein